MTRSAVCGLALLLLPAASACIERPVADRNVIVGSLTTGPNNLDPRLGTDDTSQKLHQLIFDPLVDFDDHLRVVPRLAERFEHPDALTYIATLRRGVRFHDGRELTAADVVYTFTSTLDPALLSPKRGAFHGLASIDATDRYTVVFKLSEPFESFPSNAVSLGIVPDGASAALSQHPIGTGPYRFVAYAVDQQVELAANAEYFGGRPRNTGLVLRIVPDEVMRGLEVRNGTVDIVVNDVSPDIVHQLAREPQLQTVEAAGVDYQYVGMNLADPVLKNVRVRQALAFAIDKQGIVDYLRRGLALPADTLLPRLSWASAGDVFSFARDVTRAGALLDDAGFPDPDGNGPAPRLRLTLKVSNVEFNRLQSTVIQQNLQQIGVDLEVRTYEFATLYADVIAGNFQLFTLQWTGGALADPDILRRVFHSSQAPPLGFNRGRYSNPQVDALLDQAGAMADEPRRLALYAEVQRIVAREVPYISLWHKRNVAVAQRTLAGIHLSPLADLVFLKDVARTGL
jgi:peptide/nickel transport system substrate-binding protein